MLATKDAPAAAPATTSIRKQLLAQLRRHDFAASAAITAAGNKAKAVAERWRTAKANFDEAAAESRTHANQAAADQFEASRERQDLERRIKESATPNEHAAAAALTRDVNAAISSLQMSVPTFADARQLQARQDSIKALLEARKTLDQLLLADDPVATIADLRGRLKLKDADAD